jgi:hypothetical protein
MMVRCITQRSASTPSGAKRGRVGVQFTLALNCVTDTEAPGPTW